MGADLARHGAASRAGVSAITNGVHVPTWLSAEISAISSSRHLGTRLASNGTTTRRSWDAVLDIPDEELWAVRQSLRDYLFAFIRERARQRWTIEARQRAARSSRPARCSTRTR